MGLWAMFASQLLMSVDLRTINDDSKALLLNQRVLAINQDPLGVPGRHVLSVRNVTYIPHVPSSRVTAGLSCPPGRLLGTSLIPVGWFGFNDIFSTSSHLFIYFITTKGQNRPLTCEINSKLTHYKIRQTVLKTKDLKTDKLLKWCSYYYYYYTGKD